LLVKFFGAFLDGEFVVAANEGHRLKGLDSRHVYWFPGVSSGFIAGAKN